MSFSIPGGGKTGSSRWFLSVWLASVPLNLSHAKISICI